MAAPWSPARERPVPEFQRAGARTSQYSRAIGELICERIAGGETKASICADPAMPSQAAIYKWARAHPDFAAMHAAAVRQAAESRRACDAVAEAAKLRRRAVARRHTGRRSQYTPAVGEAVCAAIAAGATTRQIAADPALPSSACLFRWLRRHPEFAAMYVAARERQAEATLDLAWEIACAATPQTVAAARLRFKVLRWRAARLAPTKYAEALGAGAGKPVAFTVEFRVEPYGASERGLGRSLGGDVPEGL